MKRLPDEGSLKALVLALRVTLLAAAVIAFDARWARWRLWRIAKEYGLRRQYLRRMWWQRKVRT